MNLVGIAGIAVYTGCLNPFFPGYKFVAAGLTSRILPNFVNFYPVARLDPGKIHVYIKQTKIKKLAPQAFDLLLRLAENNLI